MSTIEPPDGLFITYLGFGPDGPTYTVRDTAGRIVASASAETAAEAYDKAVQAAHDHAADPAR